MGSGPDSHTVRLEVPAKTDYVVLARLALSAVCRLTPLPAEDVADLKLAITEAAAEFVAVGAGVGSDLGLPGPGEASIQGVADHGDALKFAFELRDDRLVLEIAGGGGGTVSAEERELGRAIIAATVDECEYGETTRLVKYLGLSAG